MSDEEIGKKVERLSERIEPIRRLEAASSNLNTRQDKLFKMLDERKSVARNCNPTPRLWVLPLIGREFRYLFFHGAACVGWLGRRILNLLSVH